MRSRGTVNGSIPTGPSNRPCAGGRSSRMTGLRIAVALAFADSGSPYAVLPLDLGLTVAPYGLMTRAGATLPPAARRLRDLIL